jgi:hypothetical protein
MKTLLFTAFLFLVIKVNGQTISSIVSNHVFVMCDEYGQPSSLYGQHIFLVFHSNKKMNMLMGTDLSDAIDNGATKYGTWSTSGSSVNWTWNDTGNGASATRSGYSDNLVGSGGLIMKNLGGF